MIPFANVEDAVVDVVRRIDACRPAANDEVAVVEVALKYWAVTPLVNTPAPMTPRATPGVLVPIPILEVATKLVEEALVVMKPPVKVNCVLVALFGNG